MDPRTPHELNGERQAMQELDELLYKVTGVVESG